MAMKLISDQAALAAFCARLQNEPFITVDTEFMREKTYWPQLCLVQIAGPEEAWAIDPLAEGIDLAPLYDVMANESVLKVFHAARQDVEIFHHLSGAVPKPLFDTQVAAMVCGFGDSVSYENLATQLAKAKIDKSMRFTDWSVRPLSDNQIAYALADVTHLRVIYEKLRKRLADNGRLDWVAAEMAFLADPATYRADPEESWQRLRPRTTSGRFLQVLKNLAAWREAEAQAKDLPRQRIVKDETLLEIAARTPSSIDDLAKMRGMTRGTAEGRFGQAIIKTIAEAKAVPESLWPSLPDKADLPRGLGPMTDLLKVLLKLKSDQHDVAQKLIASSSDLDLLAASDDADIPALEGWRRKLFGEDALHLKHGDVALGVSANGKGLTLVPVKKSDE